MQRAIEELRRGLAHLAKTQEALPHGKPYDQDHYRYKVLHEAISNLRYLLRLLEQDPKAKEKEK